MLKLQMLKKLFFLFLLIFFNLSLNAKEPFLAILLSIPTNGMQTFNYGKFDFYCQPYGVITLQEIYNVSKPDSTCRKKIDKFYIQNPDLKYYTSRLLEVEQRYHIRFKEKRCVIYAKGQTTLSEILLKEGLSIQKPNFKDDEFRYDFFKAESKAQNYKKGIWKDKVPESCLQEISQF